MVAKVSGGSWELLGWSLSGGSPPIIEGQRRFRKVTHAWMKGSLEGERLCKQDAPNTDTFERISTIEYILRVL